MAPTLRKRVSRAEREDEEKALPREVRRHVIKRPCKRRGTVAQVAALVEEESESSTSPGLRSAFRKGNMSNDGSQNSDQTKVITLTEVKAKVEELMMGSDADQLKQYLNEVQMGYDLRPGVVAFIAQTRRKAGRKADEEERMQGLIEYERNAYVEEEQARSLSSTFNRANTLSPSFYLIGVDEVGVGPLAGPIVSCAIAFRFHDLLEKLTDLAGINDSKKLSIAKREALAEIIKASCADVRIGIVTASEVDDLNPLQGSITALRRAVTSLQLPSQSSIHIFVDHHHIDRLEEREIAWATALGTIRQTSITKGDSKSIVIAAASIVAKVYRDKYMQDLHGRYPDFGFDRNAGYGTKEHLVQLRKGNLCLEHRLSYEPVRLAKRVSMGLPPDAPPKKRTRQTTKTTIVQQRKSIPASQNRPGVEDGETGLKSQPTTKSVLSLSWWIDWFSPASSTTTS